MRKIDSDLQASLDAGATTLCRCWRLRRSDGLVLGFTDHDRPLYFDGTEFQAEAGMDASALQSSTGLAVDNAQAVGALTDDAICEDDIRAGRFDGAEVDHWLVDWRQPERRVHLFRGSLGEIKRSETSFEAELRGLTDVLNVPVGRTIKRTCDCVLGDGRCGVALRQERYHYATEVEQVARGGRIIARDAGGYGEGWFNGGILQWLSGRNARLSAVVKVDQLRGGRRHFHLAASPTLAVAVGDRFEVTAGCDKNAGTCRDKFRNFLSFRGFPHIPGEDWVVAYPKSGDAHDGTKLRRS